MIVKVVLTGFGSFSGVSLNPTQQVIEILRQENWRPTQSDGTAVDLTTDILEVSTVAVSHFLDKTAAEFVDEKTFSSETILILIHLGVDGGAKTYKLESSCYNNMTFRVPDEKGFQPSGVPIDTAEAFETTSVTQLPLAQVNATLQDAGHSVVISTDPGRYLCNYIFYKSLQYTGSLHRNLRGTQTNSKFHSLFIHVPPVSVIPLDEQCLFVKKAVQTIVNCCDV